jgi:hypothetical protein
MQRTECLPFPKGVSSIELASLLMNRSLFKTMSFCLHLFCGFVLVALSFHHASAKQPAAKRYDSSQDSQAPLTDEEIQKEMKKYLGVAYKRAGASRKGFDCSGFVKAIYQEIFGVDLPHQSSEQSCRPELESISLDSLQTGDLIFFSSGRRRKQIVHVGIYLSDGKFIHAARSQGVVISELDRPYWRSKIVTAKRLAGRIPVESEKSTFDLAMHIDSQSALSFHYEKREFPAFLPSLFENDLDSFRDKDQFHTLELDYAKAIHPLLTSHFTVFRESYFIADERDLLAYNPILGSPERTTRTYAQGFRMAGGVKAAENIYIAPSFSFFDYGPGVDEATLPKLALGLTFDLFSSSDGWSLSTGLSMPIRRYSTSALDEDLDGHALNLSLTYRHRLSERVQLSITGDNFIKFTPGSKTPSSHLDTDDQRFGLTLHFFY